MAYMAPGLWKNQGAVWLVDLESVIAFNKMLSTAAAAVCQGIIESDDMMSLSLEIEKALNYCKKCNLLVETVKRKDTLVRMACSILVLFFSRP